MVIEQEIVIFVFYVKLLYFEPHFTLFEYNDFPIWK